MVLLRGDIETAGEYVAPRSETEQKLVDIWQDAIGIDCVGIHDDYFLLSGSSIVAAIIFARIQKVFGAKLPMSSLVAAPTVALLARCIDKPTE